MSGPEVTQEHPHESRNPATLISAGQIQMKSQIHRRFQIIEAHLNSCLIN